MYDRDKALPNTNLIFSKLAALRIFLIKYGVKSDAQFLIAYMKMPAIFKLPDYE
jgi:hypothetical protein